MDKRIVSTFLVVTVLAGPVMAGKESSNETGNKNLAGNSGNGDGLW